MAFPDKKNNSGRKSSSKDNPGKRSSGGGSKDSNFNPREKRERNDFSAGKGEDKRGFKKSYSKEERTSGSKSFTGKDKAGDREKPYRKRTEDSPREERGFKKSYSGEERTGSTRSFNKPDNERGREKPFRKRSDDSAGEERGFKKNYSREERTGSEKSFRDKGFNKDYNSEEKAGESRPYRKSGSTTGSADREKPFRKRTEDSAGEARGGSREERTGSYKSYRDKGFKKDYNSEEKAGESRPYRKSGSATGSADREKPFRKRTEDSAGEARGGSREERTGSYKSYRDKGFKKDSSSEEKAGEGRPYRKSGSATGSADREKPFRKRTSEDSYRERDNSREEREERPKRDLSSDSSKAPANKGYSKKKVLEYRKKHELQDLIRLNKYISNSGICSRREADMHISAGAVSVNGKVITELGYKVKPEDVVSFGGETLRKEKPVYLLLNKPKDYITTVDDPSKRKTVMELIKGACKERVYPVGRLDRNTTGLLLLTNDGDLTKKLTHPKHGVKKIYHVETDKAVKKGDLQKMIEGIELEDGTVTVDEALYVEGSLSKKEVGVVLHSGKNRVVRRIFEALGYEVVKLDRVSFAGLTKKNLPRGKWRMLNEKEVNLLKMAGNF
jgi:23S rRNA pseudouridine2605 synthase